MSSIGTEEIMKTAEKEQFKELSEEQLKEVTGGASMIMDSCDLVDDPCPSMKFDPQCNCLG